jgi:hypothetical protein
MFTSKEQIEASLRAAGVSAARAVEYAAKAEPCVRLETTLPADGESVPLGATRIGGYPDLPAGMGWPHRPPYPDAAERIADVAASIERFRTWNEEEQANAVPHDQVEAVVKRCLNDVAPVAEPRPLDFIAQFDLTEIQAIQPLDDDIPVAGRLLFFYDTQQHPGGFLPADGVGWTLMYDATPPESLVRTARPAELEAVFPAVRCSGRAAMSPVPEDEVTLHRPDRSDPDHSALATWYADLNKDLLERTDLGRYHRAAGHPDQLQGGMQPRLMSDSIDRGKDSAADPAETARLSKDGGNWLLLMQIDSDDCNGMMWDDGGMLYVWIWRDDLRARRFDRAWVILECM